MEEKETERGHDRVATNDQPIRREEKVQNKPTAVTRNPSIGRGEKRQNKPTAVARTVVKVQPYVDRPVGSKATFEGVYSM